MDMVSIRAILIIKIYIFLTLSIYSQDREGDSMRFSFKDEHDFWVNEMVAVEINPLAPIMNGEMNFIICVEKEINKIVRANTNFIVCIERNIDNGILKIMLIIKKSDNAMYIWDLHGNKKLVGDVNKNDIDKVWEGMLKSKNNCYMQNNKWFGLSSYYIHLNQENAVFRRALYLQTPEGICNEMEMIQYLLTR